MTSLYLARHGESELNVTGVYFGATDCSLTQKGENQCIELREKLRDINFDVIITSPLKRAFHSAELISNASKEDIIVFEDIMELDFGAWEGMNYKDIEKKYNSEWQEWINDWVNASPPNGESFKDFYTRVEISLENILSKYKDKKILVVCHQGTLRVIASVLLEIGSSGYWRFAFDYGKYSLFEIIDGFAVLKKINS
ncbi:alpha-ribazole phosphatase [Clostridium botulinum]|uniref:Alpha-ribazole phosphatase n=1 Tax=Clostridium botulinum TaxID=1491 RepID=A0A9Q1UW17_CLOBO|nr:alpha-ribazole phosphatase [Clostridium botulinum]AEB76067.1 phosphoglycerate mutase family protein, putative [Clostridium botulinum BKT015925]KEI02408.1 phosphoglycerate mutase [Clostridium botulinum D str. 16868]KEI04122.1 phosphoglycerate mutase [Clostridium botulinum C/D str. Sp77]KLU76954.1 phosphoglycerate mutase [Clostridium botulinum V891]KOA76325.1 phosphoglycerate mutase [Clostridium botulinum]